MNSNPGCSSEYAPQMKSYENKTREYGSPGYKVNRIIWGL